MLYLVYLNQFSYMNYLIHIILSMKTLVKYVKQQLSWNFVFLIVLCHV